VRGPWAIPDDPRISEAEVEARYAEGLDYARDELEGQRRVYEYVLQVSGEVEGTSQADAENAAHALLPAELRDNAITISVELDNDA
jgi:hypothetical protein